MMRAAVPIAMPVALIAEMMFITLCDFLAKRYLPAMNVASLIFVIERFFACAQNDMFLLMYRNNKRMIFILCCQK